MNGYSQTPKKSEVATINGVNVYYEVYGKGEPLFLLHGFTQSSKSWAPFVADYVNDYEVYLVDLKGHGRSGMFTEKMSIRAAAEELDVLIRQLRLTNIHAVGFSYGGDVLLQLALVHPGLIRSMIVIGSCGSWDANKFPAWVDYLSYKNIKNLQWMHEEQTSDAQIRAILDQMPNYVVSISDEELKRITAKTLFVMGDRDDSVPLECLAHARKNLPESYLWILPGLGHSAHKGANKENFVRLSKEFFSEKWGQ